MKLISEELTKAIQLILDGFFNQMSQDLLGIIPKLNKQKRIVFTTKPQGLVSLFFKGLNDKKVTNDEKDVLNVILRIASGYTNALKERTESNIINGINSEISTGPLKLNKLKSIVNKEMKQAKNHFELISNAESNKAVNTGTALQISRIAESKGEDDPTIFFVVTQDDKTGFYEYVLHLLPDKKTPRLWKLSEVQSGYYTPGDQYPSLSGLHPNCRCKITYLAKGYGFGEDGKVKFIGLDHDEFHIQRKQNGLPNVPAKPKKRKGEWVLTYDEIQKTEELAKSWWKNPDINPKVPHIANNGEEVWKYQYIPYGGELNTPKQMDKFHRDAWNTYSKSIPKGSALRNTLINLNKDIINDNDRHLRVSGVHNHPDGKNHTEMRQRHLLNLFGGKDGYSMEEVKHPETGEHQGVRIKAPRHHKDGNVGETSWFYDGNSLKTEYNKILSRNY
jgi:hypothetical protein